MVFLNIMKITNIKYEIFDIKSNKQNYIIYQYEKKKDIKYDETKKEYINYKSVNSIGNMEVFKKNTNIFVITKNQKLKKNLNYKESIIKYISFMPEETRDKINITDSITEYDQIKEYNDIYVEIKIDPIYNYLSIYSGGKDLSFSIEETQKCNERKCDFDISQCKNKKSKCELKIINFDYKTKIKPRKIYYLLYLNPNEPIEYSDKNFVKFYYYENINYTYKLNNIDYLDKYYNLKEGAIVYYTHPDDLKLELYSESTSSKSTPQFWYSNSSKYYYIIYFLPNKEILNTFKFRLNYSNENIIGDISIIAVKPTDILNYPKNYSYHNTKEKFTPSILRIVFDNNLDNNLLLQFSAKTQCVDGNLFNNNFTPPINCESKIINSTLGGKNLTVIFKDEISMITSKQFNFTHLEEYKLKYFSFNNTQKEIAFTYDIISPSESIIINFLNPNKTYKYYIFSSILNIEYNPNSKQYINPYDFGYLKNNISFHLSSNKIAFIIQCNDDECSYDDYISIRTGNIKVYMSNPYTFSKFQDLSYVVFQFELKENLKYRIETNIEFGGYN